MFQNNYAFHYNRKLNFINLITFIPCLSISQEEGLTYFILILRLLNKEVLMSNQINIYNLIVNGLAQNANIDLGRNVQK